MSPSENDLRAALRHGEHDAADDLDVDRLVTAGRDHAKQRRVRLVSGAAVVLVVAAAGTGSALIWGGTNGHHDTASTNQSIANGPAVIGGSRGTLPAGPTSAATCPTTFPTGNGTGSQPPGGITPRVNGTDGSAKAGGKLFTRPVTRLLVCSYAESGSAAPVGAMVAGEQADALRDSLENAAKTKPDTMCPLLIRADERRVAIIGITSDGARLPAVTTIVNAVACRVVVTNGTAVRYDWTPPLSVAATFAALTPSTTPSATQNPGGVIRPTGGASSGVHIQPGGPEQPVQGSPIHS